MEPELAPNNLGESMLNLASARIFRSESGDLIS